MAKKRDESVVSDEVKEEVNEGKVEQEIEEEEEDEGNEYVVIPGETDRRHVKKALLKYGQELFSEWDSYETIIDQPEIGYVARQTHDEWGRIILLVKYRAKGFAEEHMNKFLDDPMKMFTEMNNKLTIDNLPDH